MLRKIIGILFLLMGLSVSAQSAEDLFLKGSEYDIAGDYVNAAKYYRQAADLGYDKAQFNLAYCYKYGEGVSSY